ncbi:MAG: 50S ribosomal protein L22 [Nanoarchaeota archaeon]|nr:50S ribosomal protein L22 [Nanoarchaeota archaeon]MBU4241886.1 50S ribosomal protein L22 [Nanoarchaeota archaeon]MBU4352474.1 50S ribosomal protein L22 [Nanoarchaeota archaeon]MBU4455997.1 50S ribosomal protein L22 [Nanoarchaeota archaeon]MCG2719416.1 50S ribosomal protein L22 [Nanoarchaeota archaeon]
MKTENIARAKGTNLAISTKYSIEICNFIKRKSVSKVQKYFADVLDFKKAIPFKRYIMDLPHQKGKQGPARYPINAVKEILGVLNSAISNAEDKGLDTASLVIENAIANKGPTVWKSGRNRRKAKRTHVEIIVQENLEAKKKVKKEVLKTEEKPKEVVKVEEKKEAPKEVKKKAVSKKPVEKKIENKTKEEKKE